MSESLISFWFNVWKLQNSATDATDVFLADVFFLALAQSFVFSLMLIS